MTDCGRFRHDEHCADLHWGESRATEVQPTTTTDGDTVTTIRDTITGTGPTRATTEEVRQT
jgi:hypothetical protein